MARLPKTSKLVYQRPACSNFLRYFIRLILYRFYRLSSFYFLSSSLGSKDIDASSFLPLLLSWSRHRTFYYERSGRAKGRSKRAKAKAWKITKNSLRCGVDRWMISPDDSKLGLPQRKLIISLYVPRSIKRPRAYPCIDHSLWLINRAYQTTTSRIVIIISFRGYNTVFDRC